ncbi:hypothetical protein [Dyadobacter crusticola]|uniref:hypothetical protein n=1 Tax=Dyadobacter crusticola TaxID=292407 RepID=UPI00068D36E5|nr:hypothetical protein [Dyadobacter crusticola]
MEKAKSNWFLIETEQEYETALNRYQEIKHAARGSELHKEKLLLAHLISNFEEQTSDLPEVDPVELIKIRTDNFVSSN